jgi:putative transposase
MLDYKAEKAGSKLMKVYPAYSSQTCPECGTIVKKELANRWHSSDCGCEMHRDTAAAMIILGRGLASISNQSVEATAL